MIHMKKVADSEKGRPAVGNGPNRVFERRRFRVSHSMSVPFAVLLLFFLTFSSISLFIDAVDDGMLMPDGIENGDPEKKRGVLAVYTFPLLKYATVDQSVALKVLFNAMFHSKVWRNRQGHPPFYDYSFRSSSDLPPPTV